MAAARALLPAWLPFVSLATIPVAFAAGWAAARLLTPLLFRRALAASSAHWTERARLAWPARRASVVLLLFLPAVLGAFLANLAGPFSVAGPSVTGLLAGAAALAGVALGMRPASLRLRGAADVTRRAWAAGLAAVLLVRAPHVAVACAFAAFMPPRLTGHGAEFAAVLLLGTAAVFVAAFGGGVAFGRLLCLFRPAGPRLRGAVRAAADAAGAPAPAAFEMAGSAPIALAIPIRRALVVSDGALALWDDAELEAVVAHETGHLTEPRAVTFQRAAGLLAFSLLVAAPTLAGEGGRTAFLAVLGTLLVLVAVGAFSRRTGLAMERRADAHASRQADGAAWARALEKMYAASLVPAVLPARSATHPDLWDRMTAAGSPPAWEKPAVPSSGLALRAAVAVLLAALLAAGLVSWRRAVSALSRRSPLAAVAATGGQTWPLSELARARAAGGRGDEAVALYRASFSLDGWPGHLANAAFVENAAGRCEAVRELAGEAAEALAHTPGKPGDLGAFLVGRAKDVARRCGGRRAEASGD